MGVSRRKALCFKDVLLSWFNCFHCFDRDDILCLIFVLFLAQSMPFACAHLFALICYQYNTSLGVPNSNNAICVSSPVSFRLFNVYIICTEKIRGAWPMDYSHSCNCLYVISLAPALPSGRKPSLLLWSVWAIIYIRRSLKKILER